MRDATTCRVIPGQTGRECEKTHTDPVWQLFAPLVGDPRSAAAKATSPKRKRASARKLGRGDWAELLG